MTTAVEAPGRSRAWRAPLKRWLVWTRSRLSVVSSAGRVVVALGVGGWICARQFGWQEMAYVTTVAAVLLVIGGLFLVGRTQLAVHVDIDPIRVTAGDTATATLSVTNLSGHPLLPLRMELRIGRAAQPFDVPLLSGGAAHKELVILPTRRRQVIPVGPATSVRGDPLGLLRRAVDWTEPVPLRVHPKRAKLDNLGAGFVRDLEGQPTRDLSTNDVAFHTLREYAPGDDSRFVHWRMSARARKLMVRQFVDTRRSHLAVVLSGEPGDYRDDDEFELAVSVAASLAVRALRDGEAVTVSACGERLPSGNTQMLLDAFSGIGRTQRAGLLNQSIELNRSVPGVSVVALVSGSEAAHSESRAAAARFGANVRAIVLNAATAGSGAVTKAAGHTAVRVVDLDDFGRQMRQVMNT